MRSRSFFIGTLILALAAGINRLMGFVFQAAVYRLIGPEGIGLFNLVYPVYILILIITTAGIPLAVSKMVAQHLAQNNFRAIKKIFRVALFLVFFSSIFFTTVTLVLFPYLVKYIFYDPRVSLCFAATIPGIFIVSLSSVFRGYFQGLHDMAPTATAQVIEQVIRITSGLLLAYYLLPRGITLAATGIAASGIIGEFFGFGALIVMYLKRHRGGLSGSGAYLRTKYILHEFFNLCAPITAGRFISTLLVSVDAFVIPRRLAAAGFTSVEATKTFGQFTGVALTLISIPTLLTISLATSLVPAIADAEAKNNLTLLRSRSDDAIRVTFLAALPFCLYFYLFAQELTQYIFNAPEVAGLVRILCLGAPFLYIIQTTTGILQGLGKPLVPVKNMIISSVLKLAGIWLLTANPNLSIRGTAYSFVLFFVSAASLNIMSLARLSRFQLPRGVTLSKSGLAILCLCLVSAILRQLCLTWDLWQPVSLVIVAILGFLIYFFILLLTGLITRQDIRRFSFLRKYLPFQ
ncbi:stage V sporulation protein B [Thermincola ferriacetica]|uniref:stage V sporulation protein B n=1 Tax=Thermincola ferriacetica TaxID=281456 RepID=UPI00068D1620|nr:stage V sporulation protein B [Thermincola ferriacetica]